MTERGEDVDDLIDQQMAKDRSGKMTYADASHEVLADAMADILPDANFVQMLAEKHQSLFQTLLTKLKAFLADVKAYFASIASNRSREANALKEQVGGTVRYLESIVKLFDNVAVEAVENYQAAVAVEEATVSEMEKVEESPAKIDSTQAINADENADFAENAQNEDVTQPKTETFEHFTITDDAKGRVTVQEQSRAYLSDDAVAFREDIDEWDTNGRTPGETFILGSTGNVLQGLGAIDNDIYMLSDKINAILKDHPEMALTEIKKIPQILENPTLILSSKGKGLSGKNSRIILFGNVRASNGLPVMTILDMRPVENHLVIDDMQKVTSAYTKTQNPAGFVNSSDVLYADEKGTAKLLRAIGLQYRPIALQNGGYIGSISYDNNTVNISGKNFSEIFTEITDDTIQNQQRTNTLTDREVLAMAADQVKIDDLNAAEQDALRIFRERLEKLEKLQLDRAEQGRLYKEQQLGAKVDREAAAKTLNRMHVLDGQMERASNHLLRQTAQGMNCVFFCKIQQSASQCIDADAGAV